MDNLFNWLIGGVLLIAVVFAIRYLWRVRKQGKCVGGCGDCRACERGKEADKNTKE